LRERLERQGYFDATVDYDSTTQDVKEKGKKRLAGHGRGHHVHGESRRPAQADWPSTLAETSIFNAELLRGRLTVYQGALGSRGRFSRRLVEADRVSMEGLYKSKTDFLDVKVDADIQDNVRATPATCL